MSGISGGYWFNGSPQKEIVKGMAELLSHRGPDDFGLYSGKTSGLAMNRRSFLDPRKGLYPLHNEDKSLFLVLDGEIYNFKELKTALEKLGHTFHTETDGEVILHLYEEHGVRGTEKLNGNFAFALFDSKEDILVLGRDRFGIKPLYYCINDERVLFASEIKALHKFVTNSPNDRIIYDFLATGVHEHTEETFFDGVKKVMPAECMMFGSRGLQEKARYWKLEWRGGDPVSENERIEGFLELFEDAVKIRCLGEGKLTAFLSGGLDSSSVVSVLSKSTPPATFSSCREDSYLDERKYIESVVQKWDLESAYNFADSKQLWNGFEDFIYHQDEPIRGASAWDHFSITRFAHERGARALFDGQGGDETLYGYQSYFPQLLWELAREFRIFRLVKELASGFDLVRFSMRERLWGKQNPMGFLAGDFAHKFAGREESILNELFPGTMTEKSYYAITKYSLCFLLKETERNASAFGIETRIPFLDHRLVEYSFSLPTDYKIRNGWTKWILRESMRGVLPELVRNRRRKIGFGTPETRWLRELEPEMRELLNSESFRSRDYWDADKITRSFNDFCGGKRIQPDFFWRVISTEIWLRVFFGHSS
jgi:asparagine synthase (glutamine-hydrolysing)